MADRRLSRRNPFEQMAPADEQPKQRAHDRVAHQPSLMREERDDQHRIGQGEAQIAAEGRQMAASVIPARRGNDGGNDRDEGWQKIVDENEPGPDRRRGERQCPPASNARGMPAQTAYAADCRASSSGRSPERAACRRDRRPKIHGSNCQSPRAQR